jgi:hypothetical protein
MPRHNPPLLLETLEFRRLFTAGPACPAAPAAASTRAAFTVEVETTPEFTLGTPQHCSLIVNSSIGTIIDQSHAGDTPSNGSESGCTIVLTSGTIAQSTTSSGVLHVGNPGGLPIVASGSLTLVGAGFTGNGFINTGLIFGSGTNYGLPVNGILIHANGSISSGTSALLPAGVLGGSLVFNANATGPSNITITLLTGETLSFSQIGSLIIPPGTGAPVNGTPIPIIVNGSSGVLTFTPPSAVVDPATTPIV